MILREIGGGEIWEAYMHRGKEQSRDFQRNHTGSGRILSRLLSGYQKKAETEAALWATVIRHINEPDESTIEGLLKHIPESIRDMLVEAELEKYKEEIPAALTSLVKIFFCGCTTRICV